VGILVWKLPANINGTQTLVDQSLELQYRPNSNVAATDISFSEYGSGTPIGFDAEGKLFVSAWIDDSTFEPGVRPPSSEAYALYQWFVCWQILGGSYYYQALGWAQSTPPTNPTCEPVQITQVDV
jgi:hypothetical protein